MPKTKNNLVALLFCVSILFFTNLVRSDVIVDKSFFPRFLSLSVVLLLSYILLFRKKAIFELNFWTFSLFGFYLWNLISCIWATSFSEALIQSQLVFLGLAVFGIVATYNKENAGFESIFIRTHLLVLLISFVLAFYKMSTLTYYDPYKISSISLNNNLYSGFLLLSVPIILTGYSLFKGAWKYVSVLTGILALFFLIIVQTRAAYLGIAFALFITSFVIVFRYRHIFSGKNVITGIISLAILVSAVFLFYNSLDATRRNAFKSKVAVWNYFIPQSVDDKTVVKDSKPLTINTQPLTPSIDIPVEYFENVNTRLIFWGKSLGLIRGHPVLGVGAGNWRISIASISEPANPEYTIRNYTYSQPHNEWIGFMSELGIVGFIFAVSVFFTPVVLILFRVIFLRKRPPLAAIFYTGFLAGFYVYASFDFPFKRVEHIVLVFSIFAFMFAKMPLTENTKKSETGFLRGSAFSFVFIVLLIFTSVIAIARIKGEYYTLKVFKYEKRNDKAVIQYCRKAGSAFYSITPNALPIDWFEGVAHYRLGSNETALNCFRSALRSTPYEVRVINDYSAVLFALGKNDQAIEKLKYCLKIDPDFDDAKFNLSAIYFSMSQPDSALHYVNLCRESQKKKDYQAEIKLSGLH